MGDGYDFCAILAAIVVPPLGVFLKRGCDCPFWISIFLTILGWIPGSVYAIYVVVVATKEESTAATYAVV